MSRPAKRDLGVDLATHPRDATAPPRLSTRLSGSLTTTALRASSLTVMARSFTGRRASCRERREPLAIRARYS